MDAGDCGGGELGRVDSDVCVRGGLGVGMVDEAGSCDTDDDAVAADIMLSVASSACAHTSEPATPKHSYYVHVHFSYPFRSGSQVSVSFLP